MMSEGCPEGTTCDASDPGYCAKIGVTTRVSTATQITSVTKSIAITEQTTIAASKTFSAAESATKAATSSAVEDECGGNLGKRRYPFPKDCPTACIIATKETMGVLTIKDYPGETDDLIASTWYASHPAFFFDAIG
jgi:hypothetical protein